MDFESFDLDSLPLKTGKISNPETRNELKKLLKNLIKEGEQIVKRSKVTTNLPKPIVQTNNKGRRTSKLKCSKCVKFFFTNENLKKHLVKEHQVEFLEEPTASTSSSNVSNLNLKDEITAIKIQNTKNDLQIPDQQPSNSAGLTIKQEMTPIDENTCEICLKQLSSKRSLVLHKTLMHTKSKSVYSIHCEKCPRQFRREDSLMAHLHKEHGGKAILYSCHICGKEKGSKYRLATHIKIKHEKSISQICPICGITLYMSGSIQKHIDLHSDVRPFKCDQCESAFKQKHDLTVHKRLHSGERPYKCKICNGRFIANTNLNKHMKSAHKDCL